MVKGNKGQRTKEDVGTAKQSRAREVSMSVNFGTGAQRVGVFVDAQNMYH